MKTSRWILVVGLLVSVGIAVSTRSVADDTCVFAVTANDVPPNIVLYIDNGAEMEQVRWHDGFDNSIDFTPVGATDVVFNDGAVGSTGFYNANGYSVYETGNKYYLVPVGADLLVDTGTKFKGNVDNGATPRWTINGRTIYLPPEAATVEIDGATDNAQRLRYSKNYLNWLFFSTGANSYPTLSAVDDGTDLYSASRFYYAKKALIKVMKLTENRAKFAIYYYTNDDGATQKQPLKFALAEPLAADPNNNVLTSEFTNNINGMRTANYSPLAEGLATVGDYFNSESSHIVGEVCQKNFVIVISPGVSSEDLGEKMGASTDEPDSLADYDEDDAAGAVGEGTVRVDQSHDGVDNDGINGVDDAGEVHDYAIPTNINGSTYLDDAADYLYNHDIVPYQDGWQNIYTYTIGFMGDALSNLFLKNASNNGNGNRNLYDTNDPEYGKYHFEAQDPDELATRMQEAINAILERTNAFAAPVVPVTRTTSGDRLYMSFFTPRQGNVWEGNVVKFGLNDDNEIVDINGDAATEANGAIRDTAEPYWATLDWAADSTSSNPEANGVLYANRNIYTYLGTSKELTDATNAFKDTADNALITSAVLGNPTHTVEQVVNYIRGADVFDEDGDGDVDENRAIITGDVLHSEPLVYEFLHTAGTLTLSGVSGAFQDNETLLGGSGGYATVNGTLSGDDLSYDALKTGFVVGETVEGAISHATGTISAMTDNTMIFFGSNDGMLHAVNDEGGTEAWGFIPPYQLHRLKDIFEGAEHQYFVDSSAKIYLKDLDGDGYITDTDNDGVWEDTDDQVILVSGERTGSNAYFALDVTDPLNPKFLWLDKQVNDTSLATYDDSVDPATGDVRVVPELGESWSEPQFGLVKTSDGDTTGTPVMFIGGGYSATNAAGKAVLAINIEDGTVVMSFENGVNSIADMDYSFASNVTLVDGDDNGFVDKVYVGDVGGQMWRIGKFTDAAGTALDFPEADENINNWTAQILFDAGCNETTIRSGVVGECSDGVDDNGNGVTDELRKFFYKPVVTLHVNYDLVYMGTGDRDDACLEETYDGMYVVKDNNSTTGVTDLALRDATTEAVDLDSDSGWYYPLAAGEKVLAETTVFLGVLYFTTFTPNDAPCVPGGAATLYALNYANGAAVIDYDPATAGLEPSIEIGGGIPSKPVIVISDTGRQMFVSVGTTNPDDDSVSIGAGIVAPGLSGTDKDMYYLWWKEMFD